MRIGTRSAAAAALLAAAAVRRVVVINVVIIVAITVASLGCGGDGDGTPSGSSATPTIEPKLSVIEREVFAKSCTFSTCHGGSAPKQDLSLEAGTHARLVGRPSKQAAGRTLVVAGDPNASYVIEKLTKTKPTFGDRMPQANAALDPGLIAAIRAWIAAGANND